MSRIMSYCLALLFAVSIFTGCTTKHYHSNSHDKVMIRTNPAGTFIKVQDKDNPGRGNSKVKVHIKDKG